MKAKKTNQRIENYIDKNPIEAMKDIPLRVGRSVVDDVIKGGASDFWSQIASSFVETPYTKEASLQGELGEGEELDITNFGQKKEAQKVQESEPGIDYKREVLYGERRITHEENREVHTKIQEIIIELKRLTASSKVIEAQFKEVTTEQRIVNPGKYHVNFFEWVLMVVKSARLKVEDAGAWLSVFNSKKAKQEYWQMFKKHGTSFGMSNERVVATQTG